MTRRLFFLCGIVLGLTGSSALVTAQDSGLSKLGQQCLAVGEDQDSAWRTVAWQTDLIAAQHLAIEKQKPLFIWAMDGHPLGCT